MGSPWGEAGGPAVQPVAEVPVSSQYTGPEEADQPPSMSSHDAAPPAAPSRSPCCLCWCCCCSCSWYVQVGRGGEEQLSRPGPSILHPDPQVASGVSPASRMPLPPPALSRDCGALVAGPGPGFGVLPAVWC